jgi:hypothetical protein
MLAQHNFAESGIRKDQLMCMSAHAMEVFQHEISKKLSSGSASSTTEIQSDASENDLGCNSVEMPVLGAPPGLPGGLRANAPEFIPCVVNQSKHVAADSVCSTIDTQSNASDEPDASSTCTEIHLVENRAEAQRTLRAAAPEFVPCTEQVMHSMRSPSTTKPLHTPAPILSSMPIHDARHVILADVSETNCCPVGLARQVAADPSEAVSDRYLQWRQYCGLPMMLFDGSPRGFKYCNADKCSLAELFAASKPGELFAYH